MKRTSNIFVLTFFIIIVSCAVITVNIYFPEQDVKEAYKALEEELMTPNQEEGPPAGEPESSFRFEFVSTAYAQEPGLSDKIASIVKKMPDVVRAYKEMGARIVHTDRLRDSGKVGEANNGLLVPREETLTPDNKNIVALENANRRTVMEGMAKAIVRINRLPQTEANLLQVRPQAVEQFAEIRRDSAKKSWWIQLPDGNWAKK
jgi:hypothetical protein